MMGTAATDKAVLRLDALKSRLAAQDAARQIKLDAARAKLERYRTVTDARAGKAAAQTGVIDSRATVALSRAAAEAETITAPAQAQAAVDVTDAGARSVFVKALPWVIGAAVVVAGVVVLRKRRNRGA